MSALTFTATSLRAPPEPSLVIGNKYRSSVIKVVFKKRPASVSVVANSAETSQTVTEKPEIKLEFIGPKPEGDGKYLVEEAKAISGEKLLRNIMLDNKMELYATYGKVMNCGGGGSCGTCIVEILDGKDLLNERTNTELRYLKKKPESWRLACQTIVGNKENSGKLLSNRALLPVSLLEPRLQNCLEPGGPTSIDDVSPASGG